VPTLECVVLERFFDESGGMQLVLHAPFGNRINRAWGLALRKRFCRGFGFELQAAANEDAIVISLGPQHSFALDEVFDYLHPNTARDVLIQALLPTPLFKTRWRWNATRALLLPRMRKGRRVPTPVQRMRADDLLVKSFPQVMACPETLPGGDLEVPHDHPLVRQTLEDCLTEAMDVEGFLEVLRGLRDGRIRKVTVDTPEPSVLARGILSAKPYAFLDDAPLEERRTQAVMARRTLDPQTADELGALDADAVRRVCDEAWPQPANAEEVHEALLWMGHVTEKEAESWDPWMDELRLAGRIVLDEGRWFAVEATRDPLAVLRGRMEALGPVFSDDPLLPQLEAQGLVLRVRLDGRNAWCDRRLLARIHRYTVDRLRREIAPVTAAEFLRFLACWQHVDEAYRLEGRGGLSKVLRQLAGFEAPARAWEASILPARVRGYRREWIDQLTLCGEFAWGRLWGAGSAPVRTTPVTFVPREELALWSDLAGEADATGLGAHARELHELLARRGAMFPQELERGAGLLRSHVEMGLAELIGRGLVTCDAFGGLRQLLAPPSRRRAPIATVGRWGAFRSAETEPASAEFVARRLLRRTGVVFRRTVMRERAPVPWRDLLRVYRRLELRGDVRGGRFVAGFDGEQYALPEAVRLLRRVRKTGDRSEVHVDAADPLNFRGILTPDARVSPVSRRRVPVI
jgi:ATP-dependent Lhr-like helicase